MSKSKVIDICSDSEYSDIMSEASDNHSEDDDNYSEDLEYKKPSSEDEEESEDDNYSEDSEDNHSEDSEDSEDKEYDYVKNEKFSINYAINKRRIEFNEKINSNTNKKQKKIVNIEYYMKEYNKKKKEYIEELKNYDEYIKVQKDCKYEDNDNLKTFTHIENNKVKEQTTRYGRTIKTVDKLELTEKVNDNYDNTNIINKKQSFAYLGNIYSLKECSHIIPDKQQITIYEKYEIPSEIYYMTSGDIIVRTSPDIHKYMELNINMCPSFSIDPYGKYYVFTQSKYVIDRLKLDNIVHGKQVSDKNNLLVTPVQKLLWLSHFCESVERNQIN
jgi:hypothetical protein